ncbi:hypothetical protein A11A3_02492 [Alcanivorax hongdengensis A-11-3]|uniref:Transcriptional regulator SutA RNAP-binding domain-containing protein n=1 Tax=Alcanivorax hongdengensis A-11-3 TaxID=1177179 RepID=L0WF88_9GAMM|nr:hypothetical protein [Alcanivorax hongdengensis]EKF75701.1 hypothetical protein A11A3_02492 [Alcanivorax hongdengensis A-11-3]
MKVLSSKEQQRQQLERDMERFLSRGGEIQQVPSGASGTNPVNGKGHQTVLFNGPRRLARTDLSEVAATIDARKHKPRRTRLTHSRPRRRLIYDDFGEPLRWVWQDK